MNREELMKMDKEEIIVVLLGVIERQAKEIAELKERMNQNSKNSSKAPSGDIYNKPKSLRKPSGKKSGGQVGHEGSGHKIMQEPDKIKEYMGSECEGCGNQEACREGAIGSETRYEIDIEIRPKVTAHKAIRTICPRTRRVIEGEFPREIRGRIQYGVNIEALSVSLNTTGMMGIKRTHEILSGVFGLPISTGTISNMVKRCAAVVAEPVRVIKEAVTEAIVTHFDETGQRVDGKNYWAHAASTEKLTYMSVEANRGQKGMNSSGVLPNYHGIGIHDCWEPYFKYSEMEHGLCCAHLLRELTGVTENYGQEWAQKMSDLLLEMKKTKDDLISQGYEQAPEHTWEWYSRTYDNIVNEALALNPLPEKDPNKRGRAKRGKCRALIDRLHNRKFHWLLFFIDFIVPFTNNQAERDCRAFKVKQKIAGCFRTIDGANDFAAILSFVSTVRKNGFSAFSAISDLLRGSFFLPFSCVSE